jgi:hypothetical protein
MGASPPGAGFAYSPSSSWNAGGVLGSSPPTRTTSSVEKHLPYHAAKKWWKRLSYDTSLEAEHFTVRATSRLHAASSLGRSGLSGAACRSCRPERRCNAATILAHADQPS